jgi:hypothetical protein
VRPGAGLSGAVGLEGTEYGLLPSHYATVPFVTAGLLGRDVLTETGYWKEPVYQLIYALPGNSADGGYTYFPYSEDEGWPSSVDAHSTNFMTAAVLRWGSVNVGRHARQFLGTVGGSRDRFVQAVDSGGAALPFSSLPLDYYASGAMYLYGRSSWDPGATVLLLQLGDRPDTVGHSHADYGTWQIWRNGRFVSRETVGYANDIAGYGGSGSLDVGSGIGHNSMLVNGTGPGPLLLNGEGRYAVVRRLESQPAYVYADVDLTAGPGSRPATSFDHWEREFVFVRSLETLVIFDRVTSRSAGDTKAFINHCATDPTLTASGATCTSGAQSLVMRTLVPASPTIRKVSEGGPVGQFRIESIDSPGTAQSYFLTTFQAKDASATALNATAAQTGGSYVVTLDGSTSIAFAAGTTSVGGSITIAGTTTPFRSDVQKMTVTDEGPAWH